MITQTIQTIIFEIKLQLKSWSFWVMVLLLNAYTWMAFVLAGQVMSGVAQMSLPLLLFFNAAVITRDKTENFTEIIGTLPYKSLCLLGGRAIALLSLFLLLGIELLLTMLLSVNTAVPVYISWPACGAFMLKFIVVCINSIGIAFFAASLTQKVIRLYSLLFILRLLGILVASNTGTLFPYWVAMLNFTFIPGFGGNPSEISGLFPNEKLVTATIVFQIVCSITLFTAAVIIEKVKRGPQKDIMKNCLIQTLPNVAVITMIAFISWQYFGGKEDSNKTLPIRTDRMVSVMAAVNPEVVVTPLSYNLYIKLDARSHYLTGKVQIGMGNPGYLSPQTIEFTLRDYLHVEQVVDTATGRALSWQQQGAYLTVSPPASFWDGNLLVVEICYSGIVWEWSNDLFGQPAGLVNFVAEPFTCLRGGYAWYPVVGKRPLDTKTSYSLPWQQESKELAQPLLASHNPVPFALTVDSDGTATFISNLELIEKYNVGGMQRHKFASPACREVFLLAGPYQHTPIAGCGSGKIIDVYHFPAHTANLNNLVIKPALVIDYYNNIVPRDHNSSAGKVKNNYIMFEAPRFLAYDNLMRANNLGFIDAIPITEAVSVTKALQSPWWSQPASRALSEARILSLWWPNCFSEANGNITDGLALYMYILYKEHKHGKTFYDNAREYWLSYNDDAPDNEEMLGLRGLVMREVFLLLDTVRRSDLGYDGVKRFLCIAHERYQNKRVLEIADIVGILAQIGAFADENIPLQGHNSIEAECRDRLNNLKQLLAKPENRLRGTLMLKLNWDFGAEVKVLTVK